MSWNDADTISILIASDVHVGYNEKDPEREKDSFVALKEIFQIAKDRNVDFILLGGDLFHENKPSRKTLHLTMELFQKFCLGDRPCEVEVISDQAVNFGHTSRSITCVNYENPNINIGMPVFSIHGNHDDPTGASELSAIDILSVSGLLNHFGKQTSLEHIEISPVLLQKGKTKLALYGLGSIRDERLHRLFEGRNVTFLRPKEDIDDWFNLFVLHQNRTKHSRKNYIPEQFIDEFFDLVVWGHEHECRIDPESSCKSFMVMQPGSPVATSLCEAESKPKHVAVLKVCGREMKVEKIRLRTVRQMFVETIVLSECVKKHRSKDETEKLARKHCVERVEFYLKKAEKQRSGHREQPEKPLIRLRIDYSGGFEPFSSHKFGAQFVDRVANPDNIVHFLKRSTRSERSGYDVSDMDAMIQAEEVENVRIEDLVEDYLVTKAKKDQMSLLIAQKISEGVKRFVDKQEKTEIFDVCEEQIKETKNYLLGLQDDLTLERDAIVDLVRCYHDKCENELKSQSPSSRRADEVKREARRESMRQHRQSENTDFPDESGDVSVNIEGSTTSRRGKRSQTSAGRKTGSRGRGRGSRDKKDGTSRVNRADSDIRAFAKPASSFSNISSSFIDLTQPRDGATTSSFLQSSGRNVASGSKRPSKGVSYLQSEENPFDIDD